MDIFEKSCFYKKKIKLPVYLEPEHLDYSIKEHILSKTRHKIENTCIHEIGFISKVLKIKSIIYNRVLDIVPKTFFMVEFIILVFKPIKHQKIKIPISNILFHGIFYYYNDNLRFILPIMLCPGFKYNTYLLYPNDKKVQYDDIIDTEIVDSKFEYDGFSCILSLYHSGDGANNSLDNNNS